MSKETLKETIEKHYKMEIDILEKDETFDFKCNSCGGCCTNSTADTILFKPFDLYNLAKGLKTTIVEIVENYATIYLGPNSGFPVVKLKLENDIKFDKICPFLEDKRCIIHEYKPGSCSLYPLGRVVSSDNNNVTYFLQKRTVCGSNGESQTIDTWVKNRDVQEEQLKLEADFMLNLNEYIMLPNIAKNEDIPLGIMDIIQSFYNTVYSLYYLSYDVTIPFIEQYKNNTASILEMTKHVAGYLR